MKKISILLLLVILIMSSSIVFADVGVSSLYQGAKEITVLLDGDKIVFDTPPKIVNGRTLVPVRKILEKLGTEVSWVGDENKVVAKTSTKVINMWIGNKIMKVNGKAFSTDVAPQIIDDRTYIPTRAVAELLDRKVYWDESTKTVLIISEIDEAKAEALNKLFSSKTEYEKFLNLTSNILFTNGENLSVEGSLNLNFDAETQTENLVTPYNFTTTFDTRYESIRQLSEPSHLVETLGKLQLSEISGDESELSLNLEITTDGEKTPFKYKTTVSKTLIKSNISELNKKDTKLFSVYLAPYTEMKEDKLKTTYNFNLMKLLNANGASTLKLTGDEELNLNITLVDFGSTSKIDRIDMLFDGKLLQNNAIFNGKSIFVGNEDLLTGKYINIDGLLHLYLTK